MRRALPLLVSGYVLVAIANKLAEHRGLIACDCVGDCWCRRPSLSMFRWVFPWRHHPAHTAEQKAELLNARLT